jgi:hypothetical protein
MALFDQNSPGLLGRAAQWMTPDRASAFQALGMGLSQLGAGQPVNLGPAYQALQERQMRDQQRRALEESGIMQRFTPEQQALLAQMEPTAAQSIIAEALFAPEPDGPASVQEYRFAVENGFQGSFQEWLAQSGGAANAETYGLTPMWGQDAEGNPVPLQLGNRGSVRPVELPEGVRPSMGGTQRVDLGTEWGILDRDGNVIQRLPKTLVGTPGSGEVITGNMGDPSSLTTQAIPGGAVDRELQAADAASETRAGQAEVAGDIVTSAALRAREAAQARVVGGLPGQVVGAIDRGSANAEIARQVTVLQSMAAAENINAMRRASPTGGALGNASDRDIQLLKDKSGALDPTSPNFERDLADYTRDLLRTIHGPEAGERIFNETWNAQPGGATDAGPSTKIDAIRQMTLDEFRQMDINGLTSEEMDALEARLEELGL